MCSTSEDAQYESGTSLVQLRMCSTNQTHHQCKEDVQCIARHIVSTNEDVQYEQGISSVSMRCAVRARYIRGTNEDVQ